MLAQILREARERAGLTQAELAARCDTTQAAVSRWERGTAIPRDRNLELVAEALSLDLSDLRNAPHTAPIPLPTDDQRPMVRAMVERVEANALRRQEIDPEEVDQPTTWLSFDPWEVQAPPDVVLQFMIPGFVVDARSDLRLVPREDEASKSQEYLRVLAAAVSKGVAGLANLELRVTDAERMWEAQGRPPDQFWLPFTMSRVDDFIVQGDLTTGDGWPPDRFRIDWTRAPAWGPDADANRQGVPLFHRFRFRTLVESVGAPGGPPTTRITWSLQQLSYTRSVIVQPFLLLAKQLFYASSRDFFQNVEHHAEAAWQRMGAR